MKGRMITKELRAMMRVTGGSGHIKVPCRATATGYSNDDAEAKCWKALRADLKKRYPGCGFIALSLFFERIEEAQV